MNRYITLQTPHGSLHGQLEHPENPRALILILRPHHAASDISMAEKFADASYASLSMELLTAREIQFADATQNVPRLTQRIVDILDLIRNDGDMQTSPLAIYATADTAPAAIRASAQRDQQVSALVCRGGLIDRAGVQALELLAAPLLMLFDDDDSIGKTAYLRAATHLQCPHEIRPLSDSEDPMTAMEIWISSIFSG